jgi:hypothetical protein
VNQVLPPGPIEQMVLTSQMMTAVKNSEDLQEGIAAWKEKRRPKFKGR